MRQYGKLRVGSVFGFFQLEIVVLIYVFNFQEFFLKKKLAKKSENRIL